MPQTHEGPDRSSTPITPRWVKVFGIIGLVLVLGYVTLQLTGHGHHGNHGNLPMPSTEHGGQHP